MAWELAGPKDRIVLGLELRKMRAACLLTVLFASFPMLWPQEVTRNFDESIDFRAYRTYSWIPQDKIPILRTEKATEPKISEEQLDVLIREAIDETLQKRGFRLVPEGEEDFRVSYFASAQFDLGVEEYDPGASGIPGTDPGSWRPFHRTGQDRRLLRKGTLTIDVLDTASGEFAWRGSASNTLPGQQEKAEKQKRSLQKSIRKILSRFPPK